MDEQRRSADCQNSVRVMNGILPLTELPPRQGAAIRRSREFLLDEQRQSADCQNSVRVMNGKPPLTEIPLGQGAPVRRWQKFSLDKENPTGRRPLLHRGRPPGRVFGKIPLGQAKRLAFSRKFLCAIFIFLTKSQQTKSWIQIGCGGFGHSVEYTRHVPLRVPIGFRNKGMACPRRPRPAAR